jgi:hypothetical protein
MMKAQLLRTWTRLKEMARAPMSDDATWVGHWIVVGATTSLAAGFIGLASGNALLWGLWISEAWLIYFVAREVYDWLRHKAARHNMKRWTKDGIMDLVGPLLHHLIWWGAYLG